MNRTVLLLLLLLLLLRLPVRELRGPRGSNGHRPPEDEGQRGDDVEIVSVAPDPKPQHEGGHDKGVHTREDAPAQADHPVRANHEVAAVGRPDDYIITSPGAALRGHSSPVGHTGRGVLDPVAGVGHQLQSHDANQDLRPPKA